MQRDYFLNLACRKASLSFPQLSESGEELYFLKSSGGHTALFCQNMQTGLLRELTPDIPPSATIGYGGKSFHAHRKVIIFCGKDKRLYKIDLESGKMNPVTPEFDGIAAPFLSKCGQFCVFSAEIRGETAIWIAPVNGEEFPVRLSDKVWFANNPFISDSGSLITWVEWDRGNMPWSESRIIILNLKQPLQDLNSVRKVELPAVQTLSSPSVSHSSPCFSPDGQHLAFLSDEDGVRSIYIAPPEQPKRVRKLSLGPGETGCPDWIWGQQGIHWHPDSVHLFGIQNSHCQQKIVSYDTSTGTTNNIKTSAKAINHISVSATHLIICGSAPEKGEFIAGLSIDPSAPEAPRIETVRAESEAGIPRSLSADKKPKIIRIPHPEDGDETEGILYRAGGRTTGPLIIRIHGGPTSQFLLSRDPMALYFAEQGFSVFNLNFRGSSGYSRKFQDLLIGYWGIREMEDAKQAASYFVDEGLADKNSLIIMGGSSGGYTVLQALCHQHIWSAGISLYGISDLFDLERRCHRFEQGYNNLLLGSLPGAYGIWNERSPINHAHKITAPLLLFHGKKDLVVPWNQSQAVYEKISARGGICRVRLFEDEGHGFRKPQNLRLVLQDSVEFLKKYIINRERT